MGDKEARKRREQDLRDRMDAFLASLKSLHDELDMLKAKGLYFCSMGNMEVANILTRATIQHSLFDDETIEWFEENGPLLWSYDEGRYEYFGEGVFNLDAARMILENEGYRCDTFPVVGRKTEIAPFVLKSSMMAFAEYGPQGVPQDVYGRWGRYRLKIRRR